MSMQTGDHRRPDGREPAARSPGKRGSTLLQRLERVLQRAVGRIAAGRDSGRDGSGGDSARATKLVLVDGRPAAKARWPTDVTPIVLASEPSPSELVELFSHGALDVIDARSSFTTLVEQLENLVDRVASRREAPQLADLRTRSAAMRALLENARHIAGSDASVLLTGDTGVGKEYLARALHASGPRADRPYVTVNCAALPENLLESQLFGHERGAFTGAERRHQGFFEAANGGTLMLDEIGELPAHLQVKLLTVLENREVVRIGNNKPVPVDVRVMAATNRHLEREVAADRFRSDLYYRLNVVRLHVPRLGERRQDVPELTGRFLHQYCAASGMACAGFDASALDALLSHPWPGNIRELHNVLESALLMANGERITPQHLPVSVAAAATGAASGPAVETADEAADEVGGGRPASGEVDRWIDEGRTLREIRDRAVRRAEHAFLTRLLQRTKGRIAETARLAGLRPRSLYDKMKQLRLRKEDFRDPG